jgi:hypothetical protein
MMRTTNTAARAYLYHSFNQTNFNLFSVIEVNIIRSLLIMDLRETKCGLPNERVFIYRHEMFYK